MSTRCWVGQKRESGIHSFFCHYDGYIISPHGVGSKLIKYYNSEESATNLINACESYGIDCLQDTVDDTKNYLYYEDPVTNPICKTKKEYEQKAGYDIDYVYLWEKGEWRVYKDFRFVNLMEEVGKLNGGDISE